MAEDSLVVRSLIKFLEGIRPSDEGVKREIEAIRFHKPTLSREAIAEQWSDKICWKYAGQGVVTALPGAIPGFGTAAQIAIEAGAVSIDITHLLHCMASMAQGIGYSFGHPLGDDFQDEFLKLLGLWSGAINAGKEDKSSTANRIALTQFSRLPVEVFKRINRRVAIAIIAKISSQRAGITLGRLVPFGIGAMVGGGFNLATMKGFKSSALVYFRQNLGELHVNLDVLAKMPKYFEK
jgi:hypothetical protein